MKKPILLALASSAVALALAAAPAAPALSVARPHATAATAPPAAKDAVRLFTEHIPPLATVGGATLDGAAYGSSFTQKPGSDSIFYGLTDRGPNVDGPNGSKVEPLPDFTPAIGEFKLQGGKAVLLRTITLRAFDGVPYNGQVNTVADTGETILDLNSNTLPKSAEGYDPEGLVVLKDGTFWISDEYGPFITHFSSDGRALQRLSPYDGSLPRELVRREPNKGMEGLTVTPDGHTLVGIMQAGLNAPDGPKSKNVSAVRIVTVDLRSFKVEEFLYLLHNTGGADTAVSEIAALSDHEFVVDERDGNAEPGANKLLFRIDLHGATDVGPHSGVSGGSYDAKAGGLLIGGKTIEAIVAKSNTADSQTALAGVRIKPVASKLFLDIGGLVTAVDADGKFYGHDKVEGVAVLDHGKRVILSNDSDFGIDALANDTAPYELHTKLQPNGQQDTGELLDVDLTKVPAQFK
jgi:Esterase-like activity of phytase